MAIKRGNSAEKNLKQQLKLMSHKVKYQSLGEAWVINIALLILTWCLWKWVPTIFDPSHDFVTGNLYATGWTLLTFALFTTMNWFAGEQSMNEAILLMDRFTKGKRAAKEGIFTKAATEKIAYRIDLEASTVANRKGSFATKDAGLVEIAVFIIGKAEYPEDDSEAATIAMAHYVSMEPSDREANLYTLAHNLLRPMCAKNTAKALGERDNLLSPQMLTAEAKKIGMKVLVARGYDLDLNQAGQEARDAIIQANAMADAITLLIGAKFSQEAAQEAALMLMKEGVTKTITAFQGIPENLFAPLAAIHKFAKTVAPVVNTFKKNVSPSKKSKK